MVRTEFQDKNFLYKIEKASSKGFVINRYLITGERDQDYLIFFDNIEEASKSLRKLVIESLYRLVIKWED